MEQPSARHQAVLATFLGFKKTLYRYTEGCTTPPHIQSVPRYDIAHDQFYQAFPTLGLQTTNSGVRRPGYETDHEVVTAATKQESVVPLH